MVGLLVRNLSGQCRRIGIVGKGVELNTFDQSFSGEGQRVTQLSRHTHPALTRDDGGVVAAANGWPAKAY